MAIRQGVQNPSRQPQEAAYCSNLKFAHVKAPGLVEMQNLVEELRPETLAGPVALIGRPSKIGEGGQFYVYKQEVGFLDRNTFNGSLVAVKRPLIQKTNTNPDASFDLADTKVQTSLGHICNEIRALTDEKLRRHPNIVRLLSWAFGEEWDRPLVLVLELAYEDLAQALKAEPPPPDFLKVRFCSDIANGLDAIHEAGFLHGDLKPANVLIFREESRFVAKLADFGFSTKESLQAAGGTFDWQAPEDESSALGDCFSYGLLIWSVLFLDGEAPPHLPDQTRKELALACVEVHRDRYPTWLTGKIRAALGSLLEEEMSQRLHRVDVIFAYATEPNYGCLQNPLETNDPHVLYNFVPYRFAWEIRPRSAALLNGLYRRFEESSFVLQSVSPEDALAVGLHFTVQAPAGNTEPRQVIRKILENSARRDNYIACGLAARLYKILGDFHDHEEAANWLVTAVDTGSIHARADLRELDGKRLSKTVESFRNRGGYNMLYWDIDYLPNVHVPLEVDKVAGQSKLHGLAAFGSCKELEGYLDEHRGLLINALSERGETALYVACARGSWKHVELLLGRGADPFVKCTASGITSLHWIFAFDSEICGIAVKEMLRAGADIHALVPPNVEVPFPHYPFVLPAGTPLHWAVAASSHDAIRALIEAGASPLLRNGSDPYMYDDRIRHLYAVGGPDAEGCTFSEPGCLGLSAMDLAAINRDPFLLRLMVERKHCVDIHSADEEGFTVLHRLATSQIFRTSRRVRYSVQIFRGLDEAEALRALIVAIKSLGGDVERLTNSADTAVRKEQGCTDLAKSSYTPLMLAMLEADHILVQALLDCGASVHTKSAPQTTAIFHLSHRANAEQPRIWQCFKTLIAHGANVNHCSSAGNTMLLTAAQRKLRDIFDFLLSQSAHIDERDETPRSATPRKSVFAFFASTEESSDEILLEFLTRYVFHSSEPDRKWRVIQDGSDSGSTLLHECAAFAMPKCIKALLHNGARVNALERKTRCALKDGKIVEKEICKRACRKLSNLDAPTYLTKALERRYGGLQRGYPQMFATSSEQEVLRRKAKILSTIYDRLEYLARQSFTVGALGMAEAVLLLWKEHFETNPLHEQVTTLLLLRGSEQQGWFPTANHKLPITEELFKFQNSGFEFSGWTTMGLHTPGIFEVSKRAVVCISNALA
ncbi:hypothetical protein P154DRAFT_583255 [Amniculicola lignicola CBS 123094]|uniref:Protein kinase domain-containing protein n=1 Tax=Amniculicola lignicola CBS 123094 TaxID=1392246 RepID=A0A6A5W1B2_9PLEO|nr:hypothetical protein P154DRAFT_583255 [Amniculicola lignicola CBS 123094]